MDTPRFIKTIQTHAKQFRREPMNGRKKMQLMVFMLIVAIFAIFTGHGSADPTIPLTTGQSVYVPIYSHIYHGDQEKPFELAATLSIRNTNPKKEIMLISADYFDSDGNFLKKFVETPIKVKHLASIRYIIKSSDKTGGSGAKFIVRWESVEPVNPPLIEAVMIATKSQQGISFVSRGQAIKE